MDAVPDPRHLVHAGLEALIAGARRAAWAGALALLAAAAPAAADAQTSAGAPPPLTLTQAVTAAVARHPAPAEAAAGVAASAEAVQLARSAYLPRVDAMWQATRATRNNVFGAFFPQFVVPISGPVLDADSFASAWGSAAGLVFSAEVFDFGRRGTLVAAARAAQAAAEAHADAARLAAGVRAADLFLTVLGTGEVVAASRTSVNRLEALDRAVGALVDAQVRPGADRARVTADLAAARSQLFADEQAHEVARVQLAVAIGQAATSPAAERGALLAALPGGMPTATVEPTFDPAATPAVRERAAQVDQAAQAKDAAALAYRPTILLQGALSARGSGALVNGAIDNGRGLWPDVPNWVAGVQVTFPVFDFGATRAKVGQQTALVTAAQARKQAAENEVTGAAREARVLAEASRRIAEQAPVRLEAARAAATQAKARYDAGLTGITDVVETERALAQAEANASLATLAVWRARLAVAAAAGDLAPFLAEVETPTGGPVRTK